MKSTSTNEIIELFDIITKEITNASFFDQIIKLSKINCIKNEDINFDAVTTMLKTKLYNVNLVFRSTNGITYSSLGLDYEIEAKIEELFSTTPAYAFFVPKFNCVCFPLDKWERSLTSENGLLDFKRYYGLDIRNKLGDNLTCVYISTILHEILHALMTNTEIDYSDLDVLKSNLSYLSKSNIALKPITEHQQEIIAHLISSPKYLSVLQNNRDYLFYVNRFLSKYTDYNFVMFVKAFVSNMYDLDIIEYIDLANDSFLSHVFYEKHNSKILGFEYTVKNKFGDDVFAVKQDVTDKVLKLQLALKNYYNITDNNIELSQLKSIEEETETNINAEEIKVYISNRNKKKTKIEDNDIVSFRDIINSNYNSNLSKAEITAYVHANKSNDVNFNANLYFDEFEYTLEECMDMTSTITINKDFPFRVTVTDIPLIIFDGEKYNYFAEFLHGELYSKVVKLKENKDIIIAKVSENYYNKLEQALTIALSKTVNFKAQKYEERPFVNTVSELANNKLLCPVYGFDGSDRNTENEPVSLVFAYKLWLSSGKYEAKLYNGISKEDIIAFLVNRGLYKPGNKEDNAKKIEKSQQEDAVIKAIQLSFSDFIAKALPDETIEIITNNISALNNNFMFTDFAKVPTGWVQSKYFKNTNTKLVLSTAQRNAITYLSVNKSGILGYDVGVGKTLASIMSISNSFITGRAKKAIVIVPKSVYDKWIIDIKGYKGVKKSVKDGVDVIETVIKIGSLPMVNLVELGNMNDEKTKDLKEYTNTELDRINKAKTLKDDFINLYNDIIKNQKENEQKNYTFKKSDLEKLFKLVIDSNEWDLLNTFGITKKITFDEFIKIVNDFFVSDSDKDTTEEDEKTDDSKSKKVDADVNSFIANKLKDQISNYASYLISSLGRIKEFDDNTIFIATHEALSRFGYTTEIVNNLIKIYSNALDGNDVPLWKIKFEQKVTKIITNSMKYAKVDISQFGFDYFVMDEAHEAKNLIPAVSYEKKETDKKTKNDTSIDKNDNRIKDIKGAGEISAISLQTLALSIHIQEKTKGENICLLTATPFENSPLEIYAMLLLTNYEYLKKRGYDTLKKFVIDFINLKYDITISSKGDVVTKLIISGFVNLNLLQRIIFQQVDYLTGYDANVDRPCKIVMPINNPVRLCKEKKETDFSIDHEIPTLIKPNIKQKTIITALYKYIKKNTKGSNEFTKDFDDYLNDLFSVDFEKWREFNQEFKDRDEFESFSFNVKKYADLFQFTIPPIVKDTGKINPVLALIKGMASLRNVALSPYMIKGVIYLEGILEHSGIDDILSQDMPYPYNCIASDTYVRLLMDNRFENNKYYNKTFDIDSFIKTIDKWGMAFDINEGYEYSKKDSLTFYAYLKTLSFKYLYRQVAGTYLIEDVYENKEKYIVEYNDFIDYLQKTYNKNYKKLIKAVIEDSPKLVYVLGVIKRLNAFFDTNNVERKGIVIYTNLGTKMGENSPFSLLDIIREYVYDPDNNFGYKKDTGIKLGRTTIGEFETLTGDDGVSIKVGDNISTKKDELVKIFNENKIKLIITTVQVGIDLNANTTALFNISVDWNPTQAKQIEGRAWRQGNKNAYCVINYPLVAGSSDMFKFQKLQEKTDRISQIWSRANKQSQFDLDEFDPQEMKLAMIDDVSQIAGISSFKEKKQLEIQLAILKDNLQTMRNSRTIYNELDNRLKIARGLLFILSNSSDIFNTFEKFWELKKSLKENIKNLSIFESELSNIIKDDAIQIQIKKLENKKSELTDNIKKLLGEAFFLDESQKDEKIKLQKETDNLKQQIKDIDDEIKKAKENFIENEDIIDLRNRINKLHKSIEKEQKLISEINKSYSIETKDYVLKTDNLKDLSISNFFNGDLKENTIQKFVKDPNTNKYVYVDEDSTQEDIYSPRLSDIDWNKATIKDLEIGIKRIIQNENLIINFQAKLENTIYTSLTKVYFQRPKYNSDEDGVYFTEYMSDFWYKYMPNAIDEKYNINNIQYIASRGFAVNTNIFHQRTLEYTSKINSFKQYFGDIDDQDKIEAIINDKAKEVADVEKKYNQFDTSNNEVILKELIKAKNILDERNKKSNNIESLINAYMSIKDKFLIEKSHIVRQPIPEVVNIEEEQKPMTKQEAIDYIESLEVGLEFLSGESTGIEMTQEEAIDYIESLKSGLEFLD
jgi:hypothetical protein